MLFHIDPLRLWVHKVLPVVYDDSLSYYEVLAKVTKKLNEVIDLTEEQNQYIEEFSTNLTNAINHWEDGMKQEWSSYKSGLNNEWGAFQRNTEQYIENWKNMAESDIEDAIAAGINQFVGYFSSLTQTAVDAAEEAMRAAENAAEEAVEAVMPTLESQFDERYAWKTAVGSPLVATTAAGMTDTTKVYVYAGSETGYVNGDWYYYDGTAWQDGGVYNSAAVVTDPTLSESGVPADAKAAGDEIADLKSALDEHTGILSLSDSIEIPFTAEGVGTVNCVTGDIDRIAGYIPTDFIDVSAFKTITYKRIRVTSESTNFGAVFYNANKEPIRPIYALTAGSEREYVTHTIDVPENAKYFRATTLQDSTLYGEFELSGVPILHEEIEEIKNAFNTFDCTVLLKNGYHATGTKIGNFVANDGYRTCIINVMEGDSIIVTGASTDAVRVWAFAKKDYTITRKANFEPINNAVLTVQPDEVFLVYNDDTYNPAPKLLLTLNRIKTLEDARNRINTLEAEVSVLESKVNVLETARPAHVKNNLSTDGINNLAPYDVLVYKNGTESPSNYGVSGAKYVIDMGNYNKCHVRFKYRDPVFHPYSGSNIFISIASMGKNNALNIKDLYQSITYQTGQIYRASGHYPAHRNDGTTLTLGIAYRMPLMGENAVAIWYDGSEVISSATSIEAAFANSAITFNVNGTTIGSVSIDPDDTIQSFADTINQIDGFNCTVYNGDGTVEDLLLITSGTISFIDTATRNGSTVYGTTPIQIPFKIGKQWHTCEFIVNREAQEAFVAYDGLTGRVGFGSANPLSDGVLVLGGNYSEETGVEISDLEIDINTYADCELLYGPITNASTNNTRQLISDINPRLMIFEGHGIFVGTETEAYEAYEQSGSGIQEGMAASTERLNIIFRELKARGYEYVTMEDILMWKTGKKNLPKRSYTIIFDDYRIENFLDYEKRRPLVKNNIKPTLPMISNLRAMTDTVTVGDKTYTISEALDIINLNGWYMCSHTKDDRQCANYTISELNELFKADILSCDDHKMHGDVLVYPYGSVSISSLKAMELSDFVLGISIVEEYYNCGATLNYRLTRTELGTRASLESVLAPFI